MDGEKKKNLKKKKEKKRNAALLAGSENRDNLSNGRRHVCEKFRRVRIVLDKQ